MTVSKVGVVYSPTQKIRRRVIVLDHEGAHDSELGRHQFSMIKGEEWLEISLELYQSFGCQARDHEIGNTIDAHIASLLGEPMSDHCAVVDKEGNILHVVNADPEIDIHPAGWIVYHEQIEPPAPELPPPAPLPLNTVRYFPEYKMSNVPVGSLGARWYVSAMGLNLSVGCETHTIEEWRKFKVSRVALMDVGAGEWWANHKDEVMAFCDGHLARIAGGS